MFLNLMALNKFYRPLSRGLALTSLCGILMACGESTFVQGNIDPSLVNTASQIVPLASDNSPTPTHLPTLSFAADTKTNYLVQGQGPIYIEFELAEPESPENLEVHWYHNGIDLHSHALGLELNPGVQDGTETYLITVTRIADQAFAQQEFTIVKKIHHDDSDSDDDHSEHK